MDEWTRALGARARIAYEPLGYEALRAANRATFGHDAIPHYAIEDAGYLLSFGADFLETWLNPVSYAGAFARMHALGRGRAGTFVAVEPRQSMTAGSADEWLRNAPGTEGLLALAILKAIVDEGLQAKEADAGALRAAVKSVDVAKAAEASGVSAETIKRVAHDFAASGSSSEDRRTSTSAVMDGSPLPVPGHHTKEPSRFWSVFRRARPAAENSSAFFRMSFWSGESAPAAPAFGSKSSFARRLGTVALVTCSAQPYG